MTRRCYALSNDTEITTVSPLLDRHSHISFYLGRIPQVTTHADAGKDARDGGEENATNNEELVDIDGQHGNGVGWYLLPLWIRILHHVVLGKLHCNCLIAKFTFAFDCFK